jgi:SPP1 family predicted phage head-tail adaptor
MLKKSPLHNAVGSRNNFVTIQRATNSGENDNYETLPDFNDLCSRFAGSKVTKGAEFMAALQVQPNLQAIYELPFDSVTKTITPRDRVTIDDRILNIAAAFNEGENNEKIILWLIEPVAT